MAASHAPPLRPAARRAQLLALFALPLAPALLCAYRVGDGATRRALALCAAASAAAFGLAARGVPVASEYMARKGNVGKDINKVRTHARTHARTHEQRVLASAVPQRHQSASAEQDSRPAMPPRPRAAWRRLPPATCTSLSARREVAIVRACSLQPTAATVTSGGQRQAGAV